MSAPSFSSFPPSFESFPDFEQPHIDDASGHRKEEFSDKRRTERRKRRLESTPKLDDESERKRRKKRHELKSGGEKKKSEKHLFEAGVPGLFILDTAGDRMNEVYGRLHAGDIPRYKRTGYGLVLGLPPQLKIIPRSSGGGVVQVGMNGKRPGVRYVESGALSSSLASRLLLPSTRGKDGPSHTSDFIPLPSIRTCSSDSLAPYRSIEGNNSDSEDKDLQSDRDEGISTDVEDEDGTTPRTARQQLLASLEVALRDNPSSISTWLALLRHSSVDIPLSSKASLNRAQAEIKLAVLERAMKAHPENRRSIELWLKWLQVGSEIWDSNKLNREWETALREIGSQETASRNAIWEEWMRNSVWRRVHGRANVDEILNDSMRVSQNVHGELAKIRILWQTAVILRAAGFSERATALFQAQTEFVFNCPQKFASKDFPTRLRNLEDFWDSELPRIGESDAKGWGSWDGESVAQLFDQSQHKLQTVVEASLDGFFRWATDELRLDAVSTMPKRTASSDDDNPYSTILFSDLQPLIIDISTVEGKHFLRLAWLNFIGLHMPGLAAHAENDLVRYDDSWAYPHLSSKPYLEQFFPTTRNKERQWDAIAGSIVAREKRHGSVFSCVKDWAWGVLDPMEIIDGRLILWDKWDMNNVDAELAHRIFEQLRHRLSDQPCDEEWEIIYLAFEAVNNSVKSALKLSRTLLSTSRASLRLWAAHIQLQRLQGKEDEARRVFETILLSSSSHPPETVRLWWAWAEMEWLANREDAAQLTILRSAGIYARSPANTLKAKRILEDNAVSSKDWRNREAWFCLRALSDVVFSSHTHGLEEVARRLLTFAQKNSLEGVPKESAWTKMLLFAWKHTTLLRRQVRRQNLRRLIEDVVIDMEGEGRMNSILLGVFLQSERGESVWGRVRGLTGAYGLLGRKQEWTADQTVKSLGRRIWELWLIGWEQTDWREEEERIRKLMMTAVSDQTMRTSPALWRIYVEFETRCSELKKAKKVLFMAVSECPLVKELYLLAFTALRSVFKPKELEAWAETMNERGIRLHRGLEDYIAGAARDESVPSNDEEGGDIALEREAEDYRRLAPF